MQYPTIMLLPSEIIEGMLLIADDVMGEKHMELHGAINAFVQDSKAKDPTVVFVSFADMESFMEDLADPDVRINGDHPFIKTYRQLVKVGRDNAAGDD